MASSNITVAYLNFNNEGGMLHYVLNMGCAASSRTEAKFIDVGPEPSPDYHQTGIETLFFRVKNSSGIKKIINKYNPFTYIKIAKEIKNKIDPNVVHVTSTCIGLLVFVVSLRVFGIKIVYTLHDPDLHESKRTFWGQIYENYQHSLQAWLALFVIDRVHVHADCHVEIVKRRFGIKASHKTYVAPHGAGFTSRIMEGDRRPQEIDPERVNNDGLNILFFGRIDKYKGLEYLFQAAEILDAEFDDIKFIIAGAGDLDRPELSLGNVKIINRFLADEEITSLFSISDIVALPYISATQSGVVPMAYAFGKPVISTNVGALSDVVMNGYNGFLIDKKNSEQIAERIRELYFDRSLLRKLKNNSKEFYENRLTWDRVIYKHIEVYEALSEK